MTDWILAHEPLMRLASFAAVFALMSLWEIAATRRPPGSRRLRRWPANLGLITVDALVLRLLFPAAAVGMAWAAREHGWGIFNQFAVPTWLAVAGAVILLDLAIYWQHVLFHRIPLLWRLHMVHHADRDLDVTSGLRFHPLEMVLSMAIKFAVVLALGAPPLAVLIFEVALNATAVFNHGNVRMPETLDRVLRWLVVTPDMHRIHHSTDPDQYNRNFGFNLPLWDRLFGSYRDRPRIDHAAMPLGLDSVSRGRAESLTAMLVLPFESDHRRHVDVSVSSR